MGVINTKKWLLDDGNQPVKVCEKLLHCFTNLNASNIYKNLVSFGMYKPTLFTRNQSMEDFLSADHWIRVEQYYNQLKKKWKGPDIPIFIFPINEGNAQLMKENRGKAGLAFSDKLFLFLPAKINEKEIHALLTHEYHHVCRLKYMNKKEKDITLLDTVILEGLAEYAVKDQCGERFNASWTTKYSVEDIQKWWRDYIKPHRNMNKQEKKFIKLLYGGSGYPRMLGYCVGYYLVSSCIQNGNLPFTKVEKLESEEILKLAAL